MTTAFKNRIKCGLSEDITATQTVLPVGPGGSEFLPPAGSTTFAVIRDALSHEVVKVTGAAFGQLTVERGQDGSTPRAFKLGATVSMRLTEGVLDQFPQKGVMRQVAYNPNAVLMPAYFGEKVAETGVEGCTHRVWQNVAQGAPSWRIVYGDMCKDLTNWRDWNWETVPIPWPWWPWTLPVSEEGTHGIRCGYVVARTLEATGNVTSYDGLVIQGKDGVGIKVEGSVLAKNAIIAARIDVGGDVVSSESEINISDALCPDGQPELYGGMVVGRNVSSKSMLVGNSLASGGDMVAGHEVVAHGNIDAGGSVTAVAAGITSQNGHINAGANLTAGTFVSAALSITAGGTITAPGGVIITGSA